MVLLVLVVLLVLTTGTAGGTSITTGTPTFILVPKTTYLLYSFSSIFEKMASAVDAEVRHIV